MSLRHEENMAIQKMLPRRLHVVSHSCFDKITNLQTYTRQFDLRSLGVASTQGFVTLVMEVAPWLLYGYGPRLRWKQSKGQFWNLEVQAKCAILGTSRRACCLLTYSSILCTCSLASSNMRTKASTHTKLPSKVSIHIITRLLARSCLSLVNSLRSGFKAPGSQHFLGDLIAAALYGNIGIKVIYYNVFMEIFVSSLPIPFLSSFRG